ncbi:LAMI_0H17084g1_1 [Lachancea mirantina]|uniref:LAMI_0H17084g1_1 n=1 Tax=Lachancea mirantina TaxID=1230905 RepID=A0A1G4KJ55_9SACH|nr:LAMI_0H17084g1_1 [Lachancea mirantina]
MQYLNSDNFSSQSTQTSSIFSAEDEDDYGLRIKDIEEYYVRTLLDEDVGEKGDLKQPTAPAATSAPLMPYLPAFAHQVPFYSGLRPGFTAPQQFNKQQASLEVEINPNYSPATGILPLTSENLKLLQHPKLTPQRLECAPVEITNSPSAGIKRQNNNNKCNRALYKTELCESFSTTGYCKYGKNCQFAHGFQELKFKERDNKFRTKSCVNWVKTGTCPYGKRCCFKHGDDLDIKVYVDAGTIPAPIEERMIRRKNTHANVQALEKMAW